MDNYFFILFAGSWLLICYTYIGYPLALILLSKLFKDRRRKEDVTFEPKVSFIIAAYNEEKNIGKKLESIWSLNYPKEKITIYVCSDNSEDKTNDILRNYTGKINLIPVYSTQRRGKTGSENELLEMVEDQIIIFTDASAILHKDALKQMVKHFSDPMIGCVSSHDVDPDQDGEGESLYVRFEMSIREHESRIDSVVGLSGSCYAARRKLCNKIPVEITRDFALPLIAKKKGFQSIQEPKALCYVASTKEPIGEFNRKIRTFCNGIATLKYHVELLNYFRYGRYSWLLVSHKVMRWLLPYFFMGQFVAICFLSSQWKFFLLLCLLEVILILMSVSTILWNIPSNSISKIVSFQLLTITAAFVASINFLTKKDFVTWNPTKR